MKLFQTPCFYPSLTSDLQRMLRLAFKTNLSCVALIGRFYFSELRRISVYLYMVSLNLFCQINCFAIFMTISSNSHCRIHQTMWFKQQKVSSHILAAKKPKIKVLPRSLSFQASWLIGDHTWCVHSRLCKHTHTENALQCPFL